MLLYYCSLEQQFLKLKKLEQKRLVLEKKFQNSQ